MRQYAFTLLELLLAIAIIGVLSALVIPTYNHVILKGHRSDALSSLMGIEMAQAKYRTNNTNYGSLAQVWSNVTNSTGGRYTLQITGVSGSGYTATATAISAQSADAESGVSCATLTLTMTAGVVAYTPAACWEK